MSFNEMLEVVTHTVNANSIRALVHFLEKWWNINMTQVATILCKQPLFKAQVWQKIHVCCDIFTSRCRMTIIFLLKYSLHVKEYFEYQHYVFQMISSAHTTIECDSFDKKWLQIAKLRLFKKSSWERFGSYFSRKFHFCCNVFNSTCPMTIMFFLLTYSLDVKESFEYQYHVFKMISCAQTAV